MGIEYRLTFSYPEGEAVARAICRIKDARLVETPSARVEFRRNPDTDGMPDAEASVEVWGLYFCAYGGHGRDYLGHVLGALVSEFGPVRVEDLE